MTEDDWLENGAPTIPVRDLTKRDLSLATGYNLTRLDKLCRDGLPARPTASRRQGLRFDLPEIIEWIANHRVAQMGGGDDGSITAAKRRFVVAQARAKEFETAQLEGELFHETDIMPVILDLYTKLKMRMQTLDTEINGLTETQREEMRNKIFETLSEVSEESLRDALEMSDDNFEAALS